MTQALYSPKTLSDWLNRSTSGGGAGSQYGYFGPGSGMLRKDITSAGTPFVSGDFFTDTFGRKVWDSLNSQTRAFNLLRKVAWGPTTGYRIRSARNRSTAPVTETGALPTIDSPTLQTINVQPKFVVTSLGTSALAQFLGTLEGGIGDALAVAQETAMIDHIKRLNEMLLAGNHSRAVTGTNFGSSDYTITVPNAAFVSEGDVLNNVGGSTTRTVSAVDYDTNTITFSSSSGSGDFSVDDIVYVTGRAGMWSLEDAIEDPTGRIFETGNDSSFSSSEANAYASLTVSQRQSGNWTKSKILQSGDSTLRHLSTGLLDQAIDSVRRNGGEPDLMITGIEQITRLGTILQANQHFIGEGTFQVKQGGEGTLVGYPTGFAVATYKGIPLFHDFDIATSIQAPANGDATRGGNVLVMDTRFVEVPVLFTTQYLESRDYLQNNMIGVKGVFLTSANVRVLDFVKQAKIVDLSDGTNLT